LKYGGDLNIQTFSGTTPFQMAHGEKLVELTSVIEEYEKNHAVIEVKTVAMAGIDRLGAGSPAHQFAQDRYLLKMLFDTISSTANQNIC
jgi:hypothetical protein